MRRPLDSVQRSWEGKPFCLAAAKLLFAASVCGENTKRTYRGLCCSVTAYISMLSRPLRGDQFRVYTVKANLEVRAVCDFQHMVSLRQPHGWLCGSSAIPDCQLPRSKRDNVGRQRTPQNGRGRGNRVRPRHDIGNQRPDRAAWRPRLYPPEVAKDRTLLPQKRPLFRDCR